MAKKIFVGNYKGGVGKTTTVFELGAGLAKNYKKKVLLIDEKPKLLGILETIYKNRVGATSVSSGNTFRNDNNLETLRMLDASISQVLVEDSVLSKFPAYQYPDMKNIFKNLIRHLDNRSNPNNYGIPITVSNGDIHDEYGGITDIINTILKDENHAD